MKIWIMLYYILITIALFSVCVVFHWSVTKFLNTLKCRNCIYSSSLWISFTFLYIFIEKVPISQMHPNFLRSPRHQPVLPSQKLPAPSLLKPLLPFPSQTPSFPTPPKSSLSLCEHKDGLSSPAPVAVQGNTAAAVHNSDPDNALSGTFLPICHPLTGFHA